MEGRDCACLAESKSNSHGKLAWARPCVGPRRAGSDSRAGMEQARCFTPKAAHMMDTRGRKEVAAIKWAAHLHGADRPGRSGPRGFGKTAAGGEAERACGGIREPGREKLRKGANGQPVRPAAFWGEQRAVIDKEKAETEKGHPSKEVPLSFGITSSGSPSRRRTIGRPLFCRRPFSVPDF